MADLIREMAESASMTPDEFKSVVKQRCFKDGACSDAQLILLLTIAHKYDLNPLAREVHAFINEKRGNAMEIAIGLDGWIKIATRDKNFNGYEMTPIMAFDAKTGEQLADLAGIEIKMHRKDWKYPGVYTAWMDEWLVPSSKPGQTSNWEQYPRHRLFGKAFQECARFTFGITEAGEPDDLERIERAELPPPSSPAQIEGPRDEFDARKNFTADGENPVCAHAACTALAIADFDTKVGKVKLCAEHGELYKLKKRGRRPKESPNGAPPDEKVQPQQLEGTRLPETTPSLAAFIEAHKVPQTRINMMLAKHDAEKVADLSPEQEKEILAVLERSYATN